MRNVFTVIFKFIARLVAVFLALLTVIATITVLLLSSIDHTLLNPRTAKQAFVKNKVYERLPAVAAREFSLVKTCLQVHVLPIQKISSRKTASVNLAIHPSQPAGLALRAWRC